MQTDAASAAYPHGSARNKGSPGDTGATPLEKAWVNDLWGWQQALLSAGGVTPSGNPDEVGASDYLTAMRAAVSSVISPPTISGSQSNYSPTGWSEATLVRLASTGDQTINGLDSTAKVKSKWLINVDLTSTDDITLAHLAVGQVAGNQFSSPTGAAIRLSPGDAVLVVHDATSGYWRIVLPPRGANYAWMGDHSWYSTVLAITSSAVSVGANFTMTSGSLDVQAGFVQAEEFRIDHATQEYGYLAARTRAIWIPACAFTPGANASMSSGNSVQFTGANAICSLDLGPYLVRGGVASDVFARVNQNAGSSVGMSFALVRTTIDASPPFADTPNTEASGSLLTSVSGDQLLIPSAPFTSAVVDKSAAVWTLTITASDAASGGDPEIFYGARLQFTDPGPRNG